MAIGREKIQKQPSHFFVGRTFIKTLQKVLFFCIKTFVECIGKPFTVCDYAFRKLISMLNAFALVCVFVKRKRKRVKIKRKLVCDYNEGLLCISNIWPCSTYIKNVIKNE